MQQLDKPFIITGISMLTGIFDMYASVYLTPKGLDASNQAIMFIAGALLVFFAKIIYLIHHTEITKAQLSQVTKNSVPSFTTTMAATTPQQQQS